MFSCFNSVESQIIPIESEESIEESIEYKLKFDGITDIIHEVKNASSAAAYIYKNNIAIWCFGIKITQKMDEIDAIYTGLIIGITRAIHMNIKEIIVETHNNTIIDHMNYIVTNKQYPHKMYTEVKKLEKSFNKITYNHITFEENIKTNQLSRATLVKYPN